MPLHPPLSEAQRQALSINPWFSNLPPATREALLAACQWQHVGQGAVVFRQNEAVDAASGGFYGLVSGQIKISTLRSDGREAILSVLEPGSWFGEITPFDGVPRTHDATALTALELLVVPNDAYARLMQDNAFAQAIIALLSRRIRTLFGLLEDATLRGLRARVARRLLALAHGDSIQSVEMHHTLHVPQETLAMMLGVSRQTLSIELNALAGEGILALGYGRIEILSPQQLEALGRSGQ
ncbi:Crp/Fnr family transcriptional regulator [Pseudomonas akapageensis]|uniref:Crp/Fnr family transcriptional regulator n=1 Tax=Pseudomonas akapageensis TaxID=2609961 RepID=UPI00140AD743|nr:Crp/Fnr family transcriptional regulator [Pseudomonas akapageensis]